MKLDTANIANITTIIGFWSVAFFKLYKLLLPKIVFKLEACAEISEILIGDKRISRTYFYFFSIKNPENYTIKLLKIKTTAGKLLKVDKTDEITKPYEKWCFTEVTSLNSFDCISIIPPEVRQSLWSTSQPEKFDIAQYQTDLKPNEEVTYFARYIQDLKTKEKAQIVIEYQFQHLKWLPFLYERKKINIDTNTS